MLVMQEADQVQQQWLEAHGQTLSAKLQVMEKQLLAMTYTSETVPALQKIDAELTKKQRQLDARDQQVLCVVAVSCCLPWFVSTVCAHANMLPADCL